MSTWVSHGRCDRLRLKVGISAERAALQQICALVEHTFTEILPLPAPRDREFSAADKCPWYKEAMRFDSKSRSTFVSRIPPVAGQALTMKEQKNCLRDLRDIALHYSAAMASGDDNREIQGRKAVTMGAILCVFDATMRVQAMDQSGRRRHSAFSTFICGNNDRVDDSTAPSECRVEVEPSFILGRDPLGFNSGRPLWVGSRAFGGPNAKPLAEITKRALFIRPALLLARQSVILYLEQSAEALSSNASQRLFDWEINRNCFAVKEDDITVGLVQEIRNLDGKKDIPPRGINPKVWELASPFEKGRLCLCNDNWQQAPEIHWLRDVVFIYKLMLLPSHVLKKKLNVPSNQTGCYTTQIRPHLHPSHDGIYMRLNKRTRYMSDVSSQWSVKSPIDEIVAGRTEEQLLRCNELKTFDNTLSMEEAEYLVSFLTVPHLAIPLVLSFFAQPSHVGQLLNQRLQVIVESVLFEPRSFRPDEKDLQITHVPLPVDKVETVLATKHGILMYEVTHARAAVLKPLIDICERVFELCIGCSTWSIVSLLLFVVRLACRVEAFCVYADSHKDLITRLGKRKKCRKLQLQLREFLTKKAEPLIKYLLAQSDGKNKHFNSMQMHIHLILIASPAANIAHVNVRARNLRAVNLGPGNTEIVTETEAQTLISSASLVLMDPNRSHYDPTNRTISVSLYDVVITIQLRRMALLRWSEQVPTLDLHAILDDAVECALQRSTQPEGESNGWKLVDERANTKCQYTVESEHPYCPSTDCQWSVSFPGAGKLS